jgi:hypothetical protein
LPVYQNSSFLIKTCDSNYKTFHFLRCTCRDK